MKSEFKKAGRFKNPDGTVSDSQTVRGTVVGHLGVYKVHRLYVVTHIPSGRRIYDFKKLKNAMEFVRELCELDVAWHEVNLDKYKDEIIPVIRKYIDKRLKS